MVSYPRNWTLLPVDVQSIVMINPFIHCHCKVVVILVVRAASPHTANIT